MPILKVTKIGASKGGKPQVFFNDKHGWQDAYLLGKTTPPPVGAVIEADTSSKPTPDGTGTWWFLNGWKLADGQPMMAPAVGANHSAPPPISQPPPVPSAGPVGLTMEPGDVLRFISNVVGQAISAKTIADPMDIGPWAAEALCVARKLRDGTLHAYTPAPAKPEPEFNDRIPFDRVAHDNHR